MSHGGPVATGVGPLLVCVLVVLLSVAVVPPVTSRGPVADRAGFDDGQRAVAPGANQVEEIVVGRPQLEVFAPDNRVSGGERVSLGVFVSNSGQITVGGPAQYEERVTTARNLRIDVLTDRFSPELADNVEVLTGTVPVGTVPEGTAGPFEIRLEVNEDIQPGTYELPVQLSYDYTRLVRYSDFDEPVYSDTSRQVRETLTLVVRDRPRFEVETSGPVITSGDSTFREFSVTNVGSVPATGANLNLAAGEGPLSFGSAGGSTAQAALGRLAPGESRTVTVRIGAPSNLPPGAYPLAASVDYSNEAGVREQSPQVSVSVPVGAEQTFAVTNVTDTLQVGTSGVVRGTVVNTGGRPVTNAVVVFPTNATDLTPRTPGFAVGTLGPGETAAFEFVVDAANGTSAGPRVLPFAVRYRNADGEVRSSDAVDAPVTVATEQRFAVRRVGGDLQVAGSGTLTGTVVNTGERTVTDAVVVFESGGAGIRARETRYPVGTLRPGDRATFRFPADVPDTAAAGRQFVTFRVRYRGAEGEVRRSDQIDATVRVGPEQAFEVRDVRSTLQAGETGTISGRIVNTGDRTVTDASVVFVTNGTVAPRERAVAVGTLGPGEAASFRFTADVPRDAGAGRRPLLFRVRYRDDDGETRRSDPIDAAVRVVSEQTFAIRDVNDTLRADGAGTVRGRIVNVGPAPVSNAVVVVDPGDSSLVPREREVAVGALDTGESAPFEFRLDGGNQTEPGERQLSFRVRYRGSEDEIRTSEPIDVRVSVAPERTIAVRNVSDTLRVGARGVVRGTVVNTGDEPLRNATVVVASRSATVRPQETEYAVGSLEPGEAVPFEFEVDVSNRSGAGSRSLSVWVRHRDRPGEIRASDPVDVRVAVAAEQAFALDDVSGTLRVGERGVVRGTVVNTGDGPVSGVVVVLRSDSPSLRPRATEHAVGTLDPGESAPFEFRVDVTNRTAPGPRPLTFGVRYRDSNGDVATSDPIDARVRVAPETDEFAVEPLEASVEVDARTMLVLRVTNDRNETFTDIRARLLVSDPLETDDPTSFIPRLAPGESATVAFDLSATDDAIPKTDSVEVVFAYTDEAGDRTASDPYFVAVTVARPETGFPVVPVAAVAAAFGVAAVWWWRRQR
jgi:hypothetical protein